MRLLFLAPLLVGMLAATPARAGQDEALAIGVAIGVVAGMALGEGGPTCARAPEHTLSAPQPMGRECSDVRS